MFDHLAIHVPDVATVKPGLSAALAALELAPRRDGDTFAMWGEFILTGLDASHPSTRNAHVAFVSPSPAHVDAFWQAGLDGGLADHGAPGPRDYTPEYYGSFLRDDGGNTYEAVHRPAMREGGVIDHVAIRPADLAASTAFYRTVAGAIGFSAVVEASERAMFGGGPEGGILSLFTGPATEHLHVAFSATPDAVRQFHADAVGAGYRSNGEPGPREYQPGYYAAFVLDPDGNNVEAVDRPAA